MSTFQQNQSNGFSPTLLSPSSTTNHTIITNNHLVLFDNSDQGSVDSDYTSLGSSKFYGNGGSSSSLHRQGRSQSIDELASTTTIPTRHFNGTLNVNKLNNDPLQFVKIHPNHDLIERAQEQLTLFESRKRLQETFKLNNHNNNLHTNANANKVNDDDTDWSKAVENWRQKREQKRKQSLNVTRSEDDVPISIRDIEPSPPSPIKKSDEPETKPNLPPPPPPSSTVASSPSTTNTSTEPLLVIPNRTASKSPSPQRIRGPSKIHEIFIEKGVEVRGFGFKLDGGRAQNRPIYISTLLEGSPADKAGLCVDDEIISMNDENIEHMTFDQVRKILTERSLRGSIKLVVKTYEDIVDDNSQTITAGPTTEHSRTPSPQKLLPNSQSTTSELPVSPTTQTIQLSTPTASNIHAPIYTFLPYTPPSSSSSSSLSTSHPTTDTPLQQSTSTSSLNMFAPKPFRSMASIKLDNVPQNNESNTTHSSPIEAFRKMLDPTNTIHKSTKNESTDPVEEQPSTILKTTPPDALNTPLSTSTTVLPTSPSPKPITISKTRPPPPPPLTSVETLLHETSESNSHEQVSNESPIVQARTSVEKQMNQLQQELLHGFPHAQPLREQRLVNIPIDLSNASIPSLNQQHDSYLSNNNRIYGIKVNSNETTNDYAEPSNQLRSSPSYHKRSLQDIPSMSVTTNRPSATHSSDRTVNEIKVNLPSPTSIPQQKNVSIQIDEKKSQQQQQQRVTNKQLHTAINLVPKKASHEDQSWITNDQRQSLVTPPAPPQQFTLHKNGKSLVNHRPAPPIPQGQHPLLNTSTSEHMKMFHYGDRTNDLHYRPLRSAQQPKDLESSTNRQHQTKHRPKSPIRTTINSNNNRVLSVSGKLHCSRCNEELGQGSAMVIESLGLYYHIECFRCYVCNIPLSSSFEGTDVRVRSNRLHCQNCFSDENGTWRSNTTIGVIYYQNDDSHSIALNCDNQIQQGIKSSVV